MTTVLVVDDMAVFREPISEALRQRGFAAREASDGEEALRLMLQERPDLVLLDVAMPRMDGMSVLRAMRGDERLRETPVILLTAIADRDRVVEASRLGVRDYMLKSSFSLRELHERIDRALGAARAPAPATAGSGRAVGAGDRVAEAPSPSAGDAPGEAAPATRSAPSDEDDGLKSLRSLVTRSEMQERLDAAAELKAMSPAVAQVLELSRNQRCSIEQLTRAVKRDHAISLKILKLANSTVYTRGEPVDSVQKAILRIGMQQIGQTVMNIAVVEMFDEVSEPRISGALFWEHSIATGLIAAEICRARGGKEDQIDASFTMGLIHDVGRLVYVETLGDTYARVLDEADRLRLPLEQVESRLLIINHADAMDRVLHAWHFPKDLVNPVAFHHLSAGNIRRMAPTTVEEVATLALANRIAHALLVGSSGNDVVYPTEEFTEALRTPPGLFDTLLDEIPDQAADIKFAMLSRAKGASAWTPALDAAMAALPRPVRAIHASGAPEFDAYRLLFRRLERDASDAPPNLGVIHLRDARERGRVSAAYLEAEREAEAGELPLLVVSPNGALRPDHAALAKRPMQTLPSTVRLDVLLEAVGGLVGAGP